MVQRLKNFYRTEAPPLPEPPDPPTPSWWERHHENVKDACIAIVAIVAVVNFGSCIHTLEMEEKARNKAARVNEFRTATDGCRLIERTHGDHAEVVYQCDGRTERFPAAWEAEAKRQ